MLEGWPPSPGMLHNPPFWIAGGCCWFLGEFLGSPENESGIETTKGDRVSKPPCFFHSLTYGCEQPLAWTQKKNLDVSAVMLAQNSVSVVSFISFLIFPEHQRREVSNDRNNGSHLQLGAESDPCHGAFGGNIKVESCCESWRFLIHWFWGAVVCFESCESLSLRRCSNLKLASEKKEWCTRPPPCWSSMLNFPTVSILILH